MSIATFALLGLVVLVGAFVQRVIGFGLNTLAAPIVVAVMPDLMPAALLITVLPMPLLEVARGWRHITVRPFAWAMAGRLATTGVGAWVVTVASGEVISLIVAAMVLVGVAASVVTVHVRPTSGRAFAAGLVTGVSATSASIGGPFFTLVLQDLAPRVVRATLGLFFAIGVMVSLVALGLAGQLHSAAVHAGLGWLPFMAAGALIAQPVRRRINPEPFKRGVLGLATIAAVAVVIRVCFNLAG